jgi:hypothetical protein
VVATLTGWLLGLLLGMRHALEPDHLTAVSTLVAENRHSRRGALLGACWGLGHTLALLAVGLVLAALHARLPARVSAAFELGVAVMLVVLGVRSIARGLGEGTVGAARDHAHGVVTHAHGGPGAHVHLGHWTFARRSLIVGLVHGLAGSGALTAFVLAELPSTASRVGYIALFGLGSVMGMAILSGIIGWPVARLARCPGVARAFLLAAGAVSTVLGLFWGAPVVRHVF